MTKDGELNIEYKIENEQTFFLEKRRGEGILCLDILGLNINSFV